MSAAFILGNYCIDHHSMSHSGNVSLGYRSVSNEDYVYSFHTDQNGLLEVTAVQVSNFPKESEPQENPNERALSVNLTSSPNQMSASSNSSLSEDGSIIDVICFYTRKALCIEAQQANNCDLKQYKYLMDAKCALAISETVRNS